MKLIIEDNWWPGGQFHRALYTAVLFMTLVSAYAYSMASASDLTQSSFLFTATMGLAAAMAILFNVSGASVATQEFKLLLAAGDNSAILQRYLESLPVTESRRERSFFPRLFGAGGDEDGARHFSLVVPTNQSSIRFNIVFVDAQNFNFLGPQSRRSCIIGSQCAIFTVDTSSRIMYKCVSSLHRDVTRRCGEDIPTIFGGVSAGPNTSTRPFSFSFHKKKKNIEYCDVDVSLGQNIYEENGALMPFLLLARKLTGDSGLVFVEAPNL